LGGHTFDFLAKITGKTYPISSIRIKKFSANTIINANKLKKTGFAAPYTLTEGLGRMIKSEFVTAQVHGSSVHGSRLNRDED